MIFVAVLLLLVLAFLIFVGTYYLGPFKSLAVSKIRWNYSPKKRDQEVVFYGASNFALWFKLEEDLPAYRVQNHGFGGSTDKELIQYAHRLLYPYRPSVVFFQTGSNDYVGLPGNDAEKVAACMKNKREMYATFHAQLPNAVFVVMGGLLLPGRSEYLEMTLEINRQLKELCEQYEWMHYVDSCDLTYSNGNFKTELFRKDCIHLNRDGQMLWAKGHIIPTLETITKQLGSNAQKILQ